MSTPLKLSQVNISHLYLTGTQCRARRGSLGSAKDTEGTTKCTESFCKQGSSPQ